LPYFDFGGEEEGFLLETQKEEVEPWVWELVEKLQGLFGMRLKNE